MMSNHKTTINLIPLDDMKKIARHLNTDKIFKVNAFKQITFLELEPDTKITNRCLKFMTNFL